MKKFIKIMTGFMNRMNQDHVSAFAAQAAFFILMSFVPFLMLLLPLVTYVSITKDMVCGDDFAGDAGCRGFSKFSFEYYSGSL